MLLPPLHVRLCLVARIYYEDVVLLVPPWPHMAAFFTFATSLTDTLSNNHRCPCRLSFLQLPAMIMPGNQDPLQDEVLLNVLWPHMAASFTFADFG